MKTQVTNISLYQNAKFLAVIYLPIGLIYALIGLIFLLMDIEYLRITAYVFLLGPLWMPGLVFVFHYVIATIYNYVASKIGGIEFELTEIKE